MAQYYQIQNLDDLKHIYADVQVLHVASDDVGQLLLPEDQILLNDGQQVVYQTSNHPTQYQQQGTTTHYIIGEDVAQQQQQQQQQQQHQQSQHQQLMYQHNQTLEHHPQQTTTTPQLQQQHYQQDTQEQQQVQVLQQEHQLQHVQQQAPSQQQPPTQQQVYYTTDHHILQQNSIVQHTPHTPQQQDMQQQQQLHIQQQYQQQQQQQIVHQQHAMQTTQQHQQVQVEHQPQPQIVYRMQPQQQQPQMLNNAHVIVQQTGGQPLLIQSPQHQEIIMRQSMQQPQQRIVYNTNRVVYSPQQQAQSQSILQQSTQHQQQQHIQLQTSPLHTQARLVQTRVATQPQQTQQQPAHQQIQQGVVFHQIQAVPKSVQQQQLQIHQQPQLVATPGGMRGAIRAKATRGACITAGQTQSTRMTTALPVGRGAMRAAMLTATGQPVKAPGRPRSGATAGSAPRSRGAARGARANITMLGGRGGAQAAASATNFNMQVVGVQQTLPMIGISAQQTSVNVATSVNQQGGMKQVYRTAQILDTNALPQPQLQILQAQQRTVNMNAPRFRSPSATVSTPNPQTNVSSSPSSLSSSSSSSVSTSSGSGGPLELDLEDSIQAVVVKKEQQKSAGAALPAPMATTTLTTYYGAKDDDDNHIVRTQNGTCITLAEFKKRNAAAAAAAQNIQQASANSLQKGITMRAGGPPPGSATAPSTSKPPLVATGPSLTSTPTPRLTQPQPQSQPESVPQPSSSVHQTSHNNYEIQTQHVLQNRSGQQMAEKDRNSAKMLVILVSGEQRLITFTLPRESCTVQDLLEQVGVPFDTNTTIQCVENPGANVDFVVTVGFSVQESPSELISRAEHSLQMSRQQENVAPSSSTAAGTNSTNSNAPPAAAAAVAAAPAAAIYSTANNISTALAEKTLKDGTTSGANFTTSAVSKTAEEVPRKVIQGYFAICHLCGFSGFDHAKCERCKRVFVDPPKRIPCVKSGGVAATGNESQHSTSRSAADTSDKKRVGEIAGRSSKSGLSYASGSRGRGNVAIRGRSGRSGRRAAEAEPVILTLSSDEEDADDVSNKDSYNASTSQPLKMSNPYKAFPFESSLPDNDENHIYTDFEREDVTDLSNWPEKLSTTLECKMARIGVYRFEPREPITFTSKGICIIAPLVGNRNETCTLHIHKQEVVKVIAQFSAVSDAMLCFCTLRTCAQYIKNSLNMAPTVVSTNGKAGSQLASAGLNEMRRIILQFDCIPDQARNVIKSIWNSFDEISPADAQNLLRRAAESDGQSASEANDDSRVAATTKQLNANEFHQLLIYPPGKGGISITTDDYLCLGTDQYLNDIIIDFYLKWVHNTVIPTNLREKTFIFSTFFYKRLTTLTRHQHQPTDVKQTAAQKRHSRVQNWTKNVNLFEKDFIIIPINEQSHWFLAIICFPALKGPVTFDTNVPVEPQQIKKQRGKKVSLQIGNTTITPLAKRENNVNVTPEVCGVGDEDSERDEAEGDESDLASDDSDFDASNSAAASTSSTAAPAVAAPQTVANTVAVSNQDQTIKQPLILIFDSLAGASRSRVVATLRDYLTCEYKAKMGEVPPRVFNKDNIHGHCVKVPQQNNFTDCGLYLLQYVEQFFHDPITNYRIPIKQLTNWFDTLTVTRKREDISILLQRLMNEKNGPHQKVILPEIPFPTLNGQLIEPPEGSNSVHKEDDVEEETVEEPEDSVGGDGSSEMEADTTAEELNGKSTVASSTHTSALVPTQGRKIVVKRRFPTGGGKTDAGQALPTGARSVLKIRKVDQ